MFDSLFYDEEGMLILNLEELKADYLLREYHTDPYGKAYVTCPSGRYPLFAYLSRIAGMKNAKKALEKFRAEKLTVLNREAYAEIYLSRQNALEDMLRRSYYYYYYADENRIRNTDDFLEAFQKSVYGGEYEYEAFCEGVREDVHENAEAWAAEEKAFAFGMSRMENEEKCDAAEAAKEAIKYSVLSAGTSGFTEEELNRKLFEHATAEYYISCIDIASENYAPPLISYDEKAACDARLDIENIQKQNKRNLDMARAVSVITSETIKSVAMFIENEATYCTDFDFDKVSKRCFAECETSLLKRRRFVRSAEYNDERYYKEHKTYDLEL